MRASSPSPLVVYRLGDTYRTMWKTAAQILTRGMEVVDLHSPQAATMGYRCGEGLRPNTHNRNMAGSQAADQPSLDAFAGGLLAREGRMRKYSKRLKLLHLFVSMGDPHHCYAETVFGKESSPTHDMLGQHHGLWKIARSLQLHGGPRRPGLLKEVSEAIGVRALLEMHSHPTFEMGSVREVHSHPIIQLVTWLEMHSHTAVNPVEFQLDQITRLESVGQ